MFVIMGATGNTGSAVAETLLSWKQPVRIVVRSADKGASWKAKGAEIAVASLDDVSALTKAFEGANGLYLLVPPNYGASLWLADQRARMDRAAEAVKSSGIGHVVFLSSVGGHIAEGTGPIRAARSGEQKLGRSGEEPDNSPPLLLYGELGAGDWHSQESRHPADVHCAESQSSDDRDQRYRPRGSGAVDGRRKGQADCGIGRTGRIHSR